MQTKNGIVSRAHTLVLAVGVPALAAALVAGVAAPAQANPCTSEWVKFKSFFDTNGLKIAKLGCQLFSSGDAAAAQKCVDDFEKNKAKVDEMIIQYNGETDSPSKIGPRGLGEGKWATGTLLAERTFAGPPVMSDSYRLQLERTGGKAKNTMTGTVCFLDDKGNTVLPPTTFTVDRDRTRFEQSFIGVAGLVPVILLQKPAGLDGHQYRIHGKSGAEPAIVSQARKTAGK